MISVSQAGFTFGITILRHIKNSLPPSSRADSIRESGICSINCFIRYIPIGAANAGKITARYVLLIPSAEIIRKLGIPVTTGENISARTTIANSASLNGKVFFASGYAAIEAKIK